MAGRDLAWLISRLKWVVNFNDGQVNQDFAGTSTDPNLHWREALNEAYKNIVRRAQKVTQKAHWRVSQDVTWPRGVTTITLPFDLESKQVQRIRDVTNEEDGVELDIADSPQDAEIWRLDRNRVQWSTSGPGYDTTLRFEYLAVAEDLLVDNQEPRLIPEDLRMLLVWEAAIFLRTVADEKAPASWVATRDDLQKSFHAAISRGWPSDSNPPVIRNRDI